MQKFKLFPRQKTVIGNLLANWYNTFMHKLAKKAAWKMCEYKNKAIYGLEMYNAIHVMTSVEKKDTDKAMPKGNRMNIAKTLQYQTFLITPEMLRKKNT